MPNVTERQMMAARSRMRPLLKEAAKKIIIGNGFWKAGNHLVEIEFLFNGMEAHAFASKHLKGIAIFLGEKIAGTILYKGTVGKKRASNRLLAIPAGAALYYHLAKVFEEELGVAEKVSSKGEHEYDYYLRAARAIATLGHLRAKGLIKGPEDLKKHILELAQDLDVNAITLCRHTLRKFLPPGKERKNIVRVEFELVAESKNVMDYWTKTRHIKDLKLRIMAMALLMGVSPSTCTVYLFYAPLPKEERKGIGALHMQFNAKAKEILKLWEQTEGLGDVKRRVFKMAELGKLDILSAINYLWAETTDKELKPELVKLRKRLEQTSSPFHRCETLGIPANGKLYCPHCKIYF